MGNFYVAGSKVRLSTTVTDSTGTPIDPTAVTVRYGGAGVATTTQTYNPGNVVRLSTGVYYYDLDTTGGTAGQLNYEWVTTGTGQSASTAAFTMIPLPV